MTSVTLIGSEPSVAPETPVVTPEVAPVAPVKRTRKAPAPQPEPTPEPAPAAPRTGFNFTIVDN